jgi:hypothetical protein
MEYVIVNFIENRAVMANGKKLGQTNQTLLIEKGNHNFSLDGLQNYRPAQVIAVIKGTTTITPYQITFNLV